MSNTTVSQFAEEVKQPVEVLLDQLRQAGSSIKSADDVVTEDDKAKLLKMLKHEHGEKEKKKITLTRTKKSEIRQADGSKVQVEVRKKRIVVSPEVSRAAMKAMAQEAKASPMPSAVVDKVADPVEEVTPVLDMTPVAVESKLDVVQETVSTVVEATVDISVDVQTESVQPVPEPQVKEEVVPAKEAKPAPKAEKAENTGKVDKTKPATTPAKPQANTVERESARKKAETEAAALRDLLRKPAKPVKAAKAGKPVKTSPVVVAEEEVTSKKSSKKEAKNTAKKSAEADKNWTDGVRNAKRASNNDKRGILKGEEDGWRAGGGSRHKQKKKKKKKKKN